MDTDASCFLAMANAGASWTSVWCSDRRHGKRVYAVC